MRETPPVTARLSHNGRAPVGLSVAALGLLGVLGLAGGCASSCKEQPPELKAPIFTDNFERPELGTDWRVTAPPGIYRIVNGELVVRGARNHPAWLVRELPRDAVIELDAWSQSPEGDIKVEAWGDGKSYATSIEYTSTGYVFIHGGWQNRITALCRMEEHGHDRQTRNDLPVVPGKKYHYLIARKGGTVRWYIDGQLALALEDPGPLDGPGHTSFGFDNWETELHFDNLVVRPY